MAAAAAARSQGSRSLNPTIHNIVMIFASCPRTGKGAAVGITKGGSSEMLCQRSLCCGINRIHAAGTGRARGLRLQALEMPMHHPLAVSLASVTQEFVQKASAPEKTKTLEGQQHPSDYPPPRVDSGRQVLLPRSIIAAGCEELLPFPHSPADLHHWIFI